MYIVRAISNGTYLSDYSRPKEKTFLQETQFNTRRPRHINYVKGITDLHCLCHHVREVVVSIVQVCKTSINSRSPPPPPAARFHSDQGISTTLARRVLAQAPVHLLLAACWIMDRSDSRELVVYESSGLRFTVGGRGRGEDAPPPTPPAVISTSSFHFNFLWLWKVSFLWDSWIGILTTVHR